MARLRIGDQYYDLGGKEKETDILQALLHGLARTADPLLEMGQGLSNLTGKLIPDRVDPTDELTQFLESLKQKMHSLGPQEDPDTLVEKIASALGRTPGEIGAILLPGGLLGKGLGTAARAAGAMGTVGGLRAAADPDAAMADILGAAGIGAATGGAIGGLTHLTGGISSLPGRALAGGAMGAGAGALGTAIGGGSGQDVLNEAAIGAVLGAIIPPGKRSTLPGLISAEEAALLDATRRPEFGTVKAPESTFKARQAEITQAREALEAQRAALQKDLETLDKNIKRNEQKNPGLAASFRPTRANLIDEIGRVESEIASVGDLPQARGYDEINAALEESIDFQARQRRQNAPDPIEETLGRRLKRQFISEEAIIEEFERSVEAATGVRLQGEMSGVLQHQKMSYSAAQQSLHTKKMGNAAAEYIAGAGDTDTRYLAKFMKMRRDATERQQMLNPGEITGPEAQLWLATERRANPQKFAAAEKAAANMHAERVEGVLKPLLESGVIDEARFRELSDNPNYASYQIVEMLGDTPLGLREMKGTSKKIADPLLETMLNDNYLIALAQKTKAARTVVDNLGRFMPDYVKRIEGSTLKPDKGWGVIDFKQAGETERYLVPKPFADVFNSHPGELSSGMKMYQMIASTIRKPFIDWNIAWAVKNPFRDISAFMKNVAEGGPVKATIDTAKALSQAAPDTWKLVKRGEMTPDVENMMRKGMMIQSGKRQLQAVDEMESSWEIIQRELGLQEEKSANALTAAFRKITGTIEKVGELGERLTKIAGYKYGKGRGWSEEKIADEVINMAGSPNFYRRGTLFPVYNSILLFSNASKEGWAQSIRGMKRDPWNYMAKTLAFDLAPKVMMYAAAQGVVGEWAKRSMDGVSEHVKKNYNVIPLPIFTANNKSVVIRMPKDHTGQAIGSMIWEALDGMTQQDPNSLRDIMRVAIESVPYGPGAVHPMLEEANKAFQFASGINPVDLYRGQNIMPERVFQAGGADAANAFMRDAWNSLGGSSIVTLRTSMPDEVKSEVEKILGIPGIGSLLGSYLYVSDYGMKEQTQKITQRGRVRRAKVGLERDNAINKVLLSGKRSNADMLRTYAQLRKEIPEIGTFNQFKRRWTELKQRMYGNPIQQVLSVRGIPKEEQEEIRKLASTWGM